MGQVVIDDPHGFDTVFSTDPTSPAAPYLKEHFPRSFEDLYDIGVIPKHVSVDTLRKAREVGLRSGARYVNVASPTVQNLPPQARRQYVEARSNTTAREAAVRATAEALVAHGYATEQVDLLARKVHSFDETVAAVRPAPFVSVFLAGDLIVKTPLVIDSSIQYVIAKAVHIYGSGKIRAEGSYLLLRCDSIHGEGYWWHTVATLATANTTRSRI